MENFIQKYIKLFDKKIRDIGITPWILLITFIPYINILIPILLCLPSSRNKIPTSYIGK